MWKMIRLSWNRRFTDKMSTWEWCSNLNSGLTYNCDGVMHFNSIHNTDNNNNKNTNNHFWLRILFFLHSSTCSNQRQSLHWAFNCFFSSFLICLCVFFVLLDKQKIENETKKQMQRDSTIEVLEEQLQLWTAKVSENRNVELWLGLRTCWIIAVCYAIVCFSDSTDPLCVFLWLFLAAGWTSTTNLHRKRKETRGNARRHRKTLWVWTLMKRILLLDDFFILKLVYVYV